VVVEKRILRCAAHKNVSSSVGMTVLWLFEKKSNGGRDRGWKRSDLVGWCSLSGFFAALKMTAKAYRCSDKPENWTNLKR
jgi:hypothetical protein